MKTIYLGLALLMGLGLVGFGVGTGFGGGGIFEGLTSNTGGSETARFADQVSAAHKRIKKDPKDAKAWAALAEAQLHEADSGEDYDSTTGKFTAKGKEELRAAANSWNRYLQLNPNDPDPSLARKMSTVFSPEALDEPTASVQALQIVIASEPAKASLYSELAEAAYLAGDVAQGDLASKKTLELVPKSRRPLLEVEFERMKKSAMESAKSSSTATTTPEDASSEGAGGSSGTGTAKGEG